MKWGLISRSETDRGIGIQSLAIYENLKPDRVLVVLNNKSGFEAHPENYPGATTVVLKIGPDKNRLDMQTVRNWWAGLDVVFSVETLYDWDLVSWAHADGVRTVVQGNPEFWVATNPQPDQWIWPTTWRLEHIAPGPVIPVPVSPRPILAAEPDAEPMRMLHIVGNRAMGDRNGTDIVANTMRRIQGGIKLTMFSQTPQVAPIKGLVLRPPVENRWDMYTRQHILVLPRRYGGLCLPAHEAMSSGLAVLMSDCIPNTSWPIVPVQCDLSRTLQMQTGPVETYETPFNVVANTIKHLHLNRPLLADYMRRSREWAEDNTWATHAQAYYDILENVK